ncbi:MAG: tetratricopeptide repeat protein [Deltaproteobacteria bacterium]|jgi:tetratricopeptide (TPR) repeat protein|nr:tetratricopeptide repeat protein [Deltaproteobacteria bacterium]
MTLAEIAMMALAAALPFRGSALMAAGKGTSGRKGSGKAKAPVKGKAPAKGPATGEAAGKASATGRAPADGNAVAKGKAPTAANGKASPKADANDNTKAETIGRASVGGKASGRGEPPNREFAPGTVASENHAVPPDFSTPPGAEALENAEGPHSSGSALDAEGPHSSGGALNSGGPDGSATAGRTAPGDWPDWDFPRLGPVMDMSRAKAETFARDGLWRESAVVWDRLFGLVNGAFGPGDPRCWGAGSRAARCLLEAGLPEPALQTAAGALDGFEAAEWAVAPDDSELMGLKRLIYSELNFAQETADRAETLLVAQEGDGEEVEAVSGDRGRPGRQEPDADADEEGPEPWDMLELWNWGEPGDGNDVGEADGDGDDAGEADGDGDDVGEADDAGGDDGPGDGEDDWDGESGGPWDGVFEGRASRGPGTGAAFGSMQGSGPGIGGPAVGGSGTACGEGADGSRAWDRDGDDGGEGVSGAPEGSGSGPPDGSGPAGGPPPDPPSKALRLELRRVRAESGAGAHETLVAEFRLGEALAAEGLSEGALRHFRRALSGLEALQGPAGEDALAAREALAGAMLAAGDFAGAVSVRRETVALRSKALGPGSREALSALSLLGEALALAGGEREARESLSGAAEELGGLLGEGHPHTLAARVRLADFLKGDSGPGLGLDRWPEPPARDDLETALEIYRGIMEARAAATGPNSPGTLGAGGKTADLLHALGREDEARRTREAVLAAATASYGEGHPLALSALEDFAESLSASDPGGAAYLHSRVLEGRARALGPGHPETIGSLARIGEAFLGTGDADGGLAMLLSAAEALEERGARNLGDAAALRARAAEVLMDGGDAEAAARLFAKAGPAWSRIRGAADARVLRAQELEGQAWLRAGDFGRAGEAYRRLLAELDAAPEGAAPGGAGALASALGGLGTATLREGGPEEARRLFAREIAVREGISEADDPATLQAVYHLAQAAQACGDLVEALALHRKALDGRERVLGPEDAETLLSRAAVNRLKG